MSAQSETDNDIEDHDLETAANISSSELPAQENISAKLPWRTLHLSGEGPHRQVVSLSAQVVSRLTTLLFSQRTYQPFKFRLGLAC
jgi:hypothetical protein